MDLLKISRKNKDLSKKTNNDTGSSEKKYPTSKLQKNPGFHKNINNFQVVKKPMTRSSQSPK